MTPRTRSRDRTGKQTMERVSHLVISSTRLAKRGSVITSGTISRCPCLATYPGMPSPPFKRRFFKASEALPTAMAKYSSSRASSTIRSDQVSGRKYSAIFSMIVCRIESRLSDDVSALATSWKMDSSCDRRIGDVPAASDINSSFVVVGIRNYKFGRTVRATNDGNQNQSRQPRVLRTAFFGLIPLNLPGRVKASQLYGGMPIVDTLGRARISPIFAPFPDNPNEHPCHPNTCCSPGIPYFLR